MKCDFSYLFAFSISLEYKSEKSLESSGSSAQLGAMCFLIAMKAENDAMECLRAF